MPLDEGVRPADLEQGEVGEAAADVVPRGPQQADDRRGPHRREGLAEGVRDHRGRAGDGGVERGVLLCRNERIRLHASTKPAAARRSRARSSRARIGSDQVGLKGGGSASGRAPYPTTRMTSSIRSHSCWTSTRQDGTVTSRTPGVRFRHPEGESGEDLDAAAERNVHSEKGDEARVAELHDLRRDLACDDVDDALRHRPAAVGDEEGRDPVQPFDRRRRIGPALEAV